MRLGPQYHAYLRKSFKTLILQTLLLELLHIRSKIQPDLYRYFELKLKKENKSLRNLRNAPIVNLSRVMIKCPDFRAFLEQSTKRRSMMSIVNVFPEWH